MKYDEKKFNSAVLEYKKILGNAKNKSFLVVFDISDKKAFLSIAPLSRAIDELQSDLHAWGIDKNSEALDAIKEVWEAFGKAKNGSKDEKSEALMDFIEEIEKKKRDTFIGLFEKPDFIIEAKDSGFEGSFDLPFREGWFEEY